MFVAVLLACGTSNPDPRKPTLRDVQTSGLGAWAEVELVSGGFIEGELIAVDDASVRVLPRGRGGIVTVRKPDIAGGRLFRYESEGGFGGWGGVGILTTLSHGFWLVFSLPIWSLWTGVTTGAERNHVILEMKPGAENWARVSAWARFPQGMPRGFAQPPPGVTSPAHSPSGSR